MHSYAPYQARSVRRRSETFDGLQPASALNAYVAALDVTTEAVTIVDRSSNVVYANAAAETLFGRGDLVGRRLESLYPIERPVLRAILRELKHKNVWRGRVPLRTDDPHTPLEVEAALRAVSLRPGGPQHFCLVAQVQSAQASSSPQPARNAADAAVLSTVGRVAGEIAHDFNNQIAVVINYSSILLRQLPDDSPLREHVAEMQRAAWRASQVAQEMLGFGGQRNAEPDDIDLNALLTDIHALFAHALGEDTRVERRLGENLWRVRARRAHLEWLLVELASRTRSTLGDIASFCITTSNADLLESGANHECTRAVVISVEARPSGSAAAVAPRSLAPSPLGPRSSTGISGLRGAELALAHAQGELTVQQLPEGGLRYRIRLPAV